MASRLFFFLLLFSTQTLASPKITFLLEDAKTGEILLQEGDITERATPYCSFNIALALMGYETGVLESASSPVWKYTSDKGSAAFDVWKGQHTPKTWIKYSVLWYSKALVEKMGCSAFEGFLKDFNYGNQDASGDLEKQGNGFTTCWLGSSLLISPVEQANFLKAFTDGTLPVSKRSQRLARELFYREDFSHGWKLYGKAGYGRQRGSTNPDENGLRIGWFVGWIERNDQRVLFVSSIRNQPKSDGMMRARKVAYERLNVWVEAHG